MLTIVLVHKNTAYTEMALCDYFVEGSVSFTSVNKGGKQF